MSTWQQISQMAIIAQMVIIPLPVDTCRIGDRLRMYRQGFM